MPIRFNGVEYEGADAMPSDVRGRYEAALRLAGLPGAAGAAAELLRASGKMGVRTTTRTTTRITVNGVEYGSLAELPPDLRETVGRALADSAAAVAGGREIPIEVQTRTSFQIGEGGSRPGGARPGLRLLGSGALIAGLVLGMAMLVLLGALHELGQTTDPARLALYGALAGGLAALVLIPRLDRRADDTPNRWALRLVYLLALLALGVTGAVMANELGGGSPAQVRELVVLGKRELVGRRSHDWQVTLAHEGHPWNVRVDNATWRQIQVGEQRHGRVRRGGLGITYLVDGRLW